MKLTAQQAAEVAARCQDAYSFDRYRNWSALAKMLARRGLNALEIEAVLRSKWPRWAADMAVKDKPYGHYTSRDLERFMDSGDGSTWNEVSDLVTETFGPIN